LFRILFMKKTETIDPNQTILVDSLVGIDCFGFFHE